MCGRGAASCADGHDSGGLPAVAFAAVLSVGRQSNTIRSALREFPRRSTTRRLAIRKCRRLAGRRHRQVRNVDPNLAESA